MVAFSGTVAASNARRVLAYGASRGLGKTSLAAPAEQASRISTARMFDIWAQLARRLDAPDLPIAMARDFKLEDLELLGFVALTAPSDLRAHRALFRCELAFAAASDEIVFARDAFDGAAATGNVALWRYLRVQADAALRQLAPRPLVDRVRDEVARMVASGAAPEMGAVAETLGTAERTLRRTLARTGTSFRQLVDDTRRTRVEELLSATPDSLTRVAFDAGFSDASALTHACRRWFGRAPSDLVRRSG